jgi:hypothetical protein
MCLCCESRIMQSPARFYNTKLLRTYTIKTKNKLRGLQSTSELYRLSDRHLLAKCSANFCG